MNLRRMRSELFQDHSTSSMLRQKHQYYDHRQFQVLPWTISLHIKNRSGGSRSKTKTSKTFGMIGPPAPSNPFRTFLESIVSF